MTETQAQSPAQPAAQSGQAKRGRRRNPDGTMPLMEHVYELRSRLLVAVAAIVVTTAFGFWWYGHGFLGMQSLGGILTDPYCAIPAGSRLELGTDSNECRLLATGPFEQFMLRLKVAATAGVVLASPVWLYELWAFITPGLHKNERRYGIVFTVLAAVLFVTGAILAYVVVVHALEFLLSIGDNVQTTALSGSQYFSFIIHLILIFGVSFEIPLLIAMLNVVGVLSYEVLARSRRGIIMAIFVFAAVASPGQDPFSMLALAVAVCVLVEVSIQFARIHDKRKGRRRPEWLEVDDDEATPLEPAAGQEPGASAAGDIGTPAPVGRPAPVRAGGSPVTPTAPATYRPQDTTHPPTPGPAAGPAHYDDII